MLQLISMNKWAEIIVFLQLWSTEKINWQLWKWLRPICQVWSRGLWRTFWGRHLPTGKAASDQMCIATLSRWAVPATQRRNWGDARGTKSNVFNTNAAAESLSKRMQPLSSCMPPFAAFVRRKSNRQWKWLSTVLLLRRRGWSIQYRNLTLIADHNQWLPLLGDEVP